MSRVEASSAISWELEMDEGYAAVSTHIRINFFVFSPRIEAYEKKNCL